MILQDIRELNTGERQLRRFGLLVGGVLLGLGLLLFARHHGAYLVLVAFGVPLLVAGAIFPRCLKYVYIGWMSVAIVLGFIVGHVVLTIFFFLVMTPIGLACRLAGKDFLRLKPSPAASTYWIARQTRKKKPEDYERQF